jgi:PiT family inorganic phosphate transporter
MDPIIWLLIGLALFLAFGIGSQDQTFATTVGSGSMNIKRSVIIGGILAFLGTIFLSSAVGKTIGRSLLGPGVEYTYEIVIAIIASTAIWLIIASKMGAPISTTHTIVGSVFGVGIMWSLINGYPLSASMNWFSLLRVAMGWVLSPILGYLGAVVVTYYLKRSLRRLNQGFLHIEKYESTFRYLIIIFTCLNQISRAGNDSANALGVFYSLQAMGQLDAEMMPFIVLSVASLYMIGLFLVARNVISNVGFSTGNLRPSEAVAIESSSAIVMFLATVLGFPISGTHTAIFSLFGNARMRGESPDRRALFHMIVTWVVTFPIGAILSAGVYALLIFL